MTDLLDSLQWQRQKIEIRDIIREEIAAANSETRWVSNSAFCKYHGISTATLWRYRDIFTAHKAVRGKGKAARYDKFFNLHPFLAKRMTKIRRGVNK